MKLGCLIHLAILGLMIGGYHAWLSPTVDSPELWIIAVVAALLSFLGFSILYNAWLASRDSAALAAALRGMPPRHGKWSAVSGRLTATGDSLSAPFSGRECVIYEYEISHDIEVSNRDDNGPQSRKIVDFLGLRMTDCAIQTDTDSIRLIGAPNLEAIPTQNCFDAGDLDRAKAFVLSTDWLDCIGSNLIGQTGTTWTTLTDVDESFRFDWQMVSLESYTWLNVEPTDDFASESQESSPANPGPPRLTEKLLADGTPVVALGFYDGTQGALQSPVGNEAHRFRLYSDSLERVQAQSGLSTGQRLVGGLLLLLVVNGGLFLGHLAYSRHESTRQAWINQLRKDVQHGDRDSVQRGLNRLQNADLPNEHGVTLLMEIEDGEIAQLLIDGGANVNARDESGHTAVMFAARSNRVNVLRRLIAAGADVNAVNSLYRTTALVQAVDAEQLESEQILLAAGAFDDRVTATNGEALTAEDEPVEVCRKYIQAIHARDARRLQELSTADRPATFDDVDWDVWHHTRPVQPQQDSGFTRGDDATVAMGGQTPKNFQVVWYFQLHREQGLWKVVRERWPTKHLTTK